MPPTSNGVSTAYVVSNQSSVTLIGTEVPIAFDPISKPTPAAFICSAMSRSSATQPPCPPVCAIPTVHCTCGVAPGVIAEVSSRNASPAAGLSGCFLFSVAAVPPDQVSGFTIFSVMETGNLLNTPDRGNCPGTIILGAALTPL